MVDNLELSWIDNKLINTIKIIWSANSGFSNGFIKISTLDCHTYSIGIEMIRYKIK